MLVWTMRTMAGIASVVAFQTNGFGLVLQWVM